MEEPLPRNSLTYVEVVDDFLNSERQYLRDLQMLRNVFREHLASQLDTVNQVRLLRLRSSGRNVIPKSASPNPSSRPICHSQKRQS